ncbi:uncharacterized protein EV420DRAFT_1017761 [Desarmillaria tabescens]|uniref:UBA domain-containing protein n=1 Tax=Armillaria tabescens TaxID=1929756 RepID=A0AA39JJK5_ARMTA|nr:uncharacterized protein EV420DRAFT_1017761 [Desarmillaria tabescens]KAK0443962.1 hypothetical protein EV420DRAFT_1017761 [Desarmillaria tabescens]
MSDSFADLWSSTAPSTKPAPQKLGSYSSVSNQGVRQTQNDIFSMLSSAGSSAPGSRSMTPASRTVSPPGPPPSNPASSGDAFSGLLSGTLASKPPSQMTIAERAAEAERERMEKLQQSHRAAPIQTSSAWEGLDSLGQKSSPSVVSTSQSFSDDDWGFGTSSPGTSKPAASTAVADDDDWGLADFGPSTKQSQKSSPKPATRTQNIWDMDSNQEPFRRGTDSPSNDFDFGDHEDELLGSHAQGTAYDDDILGELGRPVDVVPRRPSPGNQGSAQTPQPSRQSPIRTVSPPPHILGQLVEMGFSIQQARIALASTDSGLDVEAALETLLNNGAGNSSQSTPPPTLPRRPPLPGRDSSNNSSQSSTRHKERERSTSSPSASHAESNIQEQADKLLAQASELGLSFFNKANAAWKEGRERVQKAYAERVGADTAGDSRSGSRTSNTHGRPKWMQTDDSWKADNDKQPPPNGSTGRFADERKTKSPLPISGQSSNPQPRPQPKAVDLFSTMDEASVAYVSPFRRGKPKVTSPVQNPQPVRVTTPSPSLKPLISASSSSISTSQSHKNLGAEKFKLGQYGEAESAYTQAIDCLPSGHLLLVPLYNNRALVRLKTGDYNGAAGDAGTVVELVGETTWRDEQARVKTSEEGAGVDLGDGLVKAWRRRAEALEGREKWDDARKDWEKVAGANWAASNMRGEGVRGVGRCRKMVAAEKQETSVPPPRTAKPRPVPARPPPRRGPTPPSQALSNLKKANDAAEAEDNAKYELKDVVDGKLLAWKGGKETNIRALIASLDSVLWPELGLQKTSIAELVTPAQVKIRYTKAIAKLHPDKLNPNNSTLEQRMIANGVFGTLNEAWNAFKQ